MSHLQSKKYNPIAFLLCKQNIAKRNFRLRAKLFEQNRHRKRKEEIHPGIKSTEACTPGVLTTVKMVTLAWWRRRDNKFQYFS